jgi:hypothetical protein
MDIIPAALYGGIVAFVLGSLASITGMPLSDTRRFSRRTSRIVHLVVAVCGAIVAGAAWCFDRLFLHH